MQAALAESAWVHNNFAEDFPPRWHIDPPHLTHARNTLRGKRVTELVEELNDRAIGIWVPTDLLTAYGSATRVRAVAGAKRRLYRTFITWTENYALCGRVGDRIVGQVLDDLRGTYLWLPPEHQPGQVREIGGRAVPFGPLDGTGIWVPDASKPSEGHTRFGVEVKNTRSILYPYHHEVWDLLGKLVDFPDVVPVLVARRIHYTTFAFFQRIGALGIKTHQQWFATSIAEERFKRVVEGLRLADAVQFDPAKPPRGLTKWFRETGPEQASVALPKWEKAAPILGGYVALREPGLSSDERQDLWASLVGELQLAGILPEPPEVDEVDEPDWDYDDE
ncbi:MAG TPA: hypothetical protein VI789_07025 [Dehalococcoidia bacterium]|nr:hypothetical protein [Dehalococcoidia bacterium]